MLYSKTKKAGGYDSGWINPSERLLFRYAEPLAASAFLSGISFGISAGAAVPAYRSYRNVRVHSSELRHPKNLNSTAASVNGATEHKLRSSMRYMSDFYTSTAWKNKREAILNRDGYMCRNCKRYGRQRPATTVHHIKHFDEYPELALESDNLISLCEACHNLMHPEKAKKSNKSRGNRRYF